MIRSVISALFLIVSIVLIIKNAGGQTILRDTSFTVYSSFIKERKKRPYIEIAQPSLMPGVKSKENFIYNIVGDRKLAADIFYPGGKINERISGYCNNFWRGLEVGR